MNPPVVAGNVQYGPSYSMQYQKRSAKRDALDFPQANPKFPLPSRPKLLQNHLFKTKLEANKFVSITKTFLLARKDHEIIIKIIVSGKYFVIISARMVLIYPPAQNRYMQEKIIEN